MEKKALLIALLSAIGISTFAIERPAFAQTPPDYSTSSEPIDDTDPRALSTFEPALDPYGSWVDDDQYGQVWIPDPYVVGSDFVPYVSAGHWAYTDQGYFWQSDYSWGWMTFHYGRWALTVGGWAWIPGARYAPSWCDWRYGGGYVGWAPLAPTWIWRHGVAYSYSFGANPMVFAPVHNFFSPYPRYALVEPQAVPRVITHTTPWVQHAPSARSFYGPDPRVVGIPSPRVHQARIAPPVYAQPRAVPWRAPATPHVQTAPNVRPAPQPYAPTPRAAPYAPAPRVMPQPQPYAPVRPPPPTMVRPPPAPAPRVAPNVAPAPAPRVAPAPAPAPAPRIAPAPAPAPRVAPPQVAPPAPRSGGHGHR